MMKRNTSDSEPGFSYGQVDRGVVTGEKGGYVRPNQRLEMSTVSMRDEN